MGIPVIKLDRPMEEILVERIKAYEQRYEMSSDEMARALQDASEHETDEKLKWMQDCTVLHYLTNETPRLEHLGPLRVHPPQAH